MSISLHTLQYSIIILIFKIIYGYPNSLSRLSDIFHKANINSSILIATDALSEGQNLQDADMVINYDIHWNPVRIIQRMGRIDRLGSPNEKILGINFWPSNNIRFNTEAPAGRSYNML